MVWRRPENASNVRIQGTSHLIVHEAPKAVGACCFELVLSMILLMLLDL